MAVLFRFQVDDPVIVGYLPTETIQAITTWQNSEEYSFELHSGHLTGYPIYIRPAGNRDGANVPKFDTLNKAATDYANIASFANSGKLSGLSTGAKNEILTIIRNNWAVSSLLARNYWNNAPVNNQTEEEIEREAWAARESDETGQHFEEISRDQLHKIYGSY